MTKIKITSEQYNKILLHEQHVRTNSLKTLNEGIKEVVLGVSMLMGINLTGLNKEQAEKALKDKNVMLEISSTFENESKIDELIKNLEEKGMVNAKEKLSSKANQVITKFNKISEENNFGINLGLFIMSKLKNK